MQLVRVLATAAAMGLAAQSPPQAERDLFRASEYHLQFDQRLRIEGGAPIIILGSVLDATDIGEPKTSKGDSRILVQHTRLSVHIEEVIKGNVGEDRADIDLFTYSQQNKVDLGLPLYIPEIGQRRIYFLRAENHRYRSVGDVTNYNIPVRTGLHSKGFCKGKTPGCCIAEILLIPGTDAAVESFVAHLYEAEYTASILCSKRTAIDLLTQLTQHADKTIAEGAEQLLDALENDPR